MKKSILFCLISLILLIILFSVFNKKNDNITKIKFSSWGSQSETIILKNLINEYENNNPNIKIEFIHIPQNYFQKIQLLFASNLQPDVVFFNNQNIQMYINANLLEDLTPYINKQDFYKESLNCFEKDEKIYAIPRDISNLVIYYNVDLLRKSGIKLKNKISSIYELKDIATKLTNKNHYGINFEEDPLFWSYYIASNGGGILSDNKKELLINTKESIDAIQLYTDIVNKYHAAPNKAQIGSMTTAQMFINEKIVMYLGGRWMVPKFRETIKFNWDITEFPSSSNNKVYIDASGWSVSKASKHKKEAIDFINFLSSDSSQEKLAETGLIIPARIKTSELTLKKDKYKKPEHSYIFTDMLRNAKSRPVNENYAMINDILKEQTQSVFSGNKTPDEAFDKRTIKKLENLL